MDVPAVGQAGRRTSDHTPRERGLAWLRPPDLYHVPPVLRAVAQRQHW
jgi:hypothetical protein